MDPSPEDRREDRIMERQTEASEDRCVPVKASGAEGLHSSPTWTSSILALERSEVRPASCGRATALSSRSPGGSANGDDPPDRRGPPTPMAPRDAQRGCGPRRRLQEHSQEATAHQGSPTESVALRPLGKSGAPVHSGTDRSDDSSLTHPDAAEERMSPSSSWVRVPAGSSGLTVARPAAYLRYRTSAERENRERRRRKRLRRSILLAVVIVLCLAFGPLVVKLTQAKIAFANTAAAWEEQKDTDAAGEGLSQLPGDTTLHLGLTSAVAAEAEHAGDPDAWPR